MEQTFMARESNQIADQFKKRLKKQLQRFHKARSTALLLVELMLVFMRSAK